MQLFLGMRRFGDASIPSQRLPAGMPQKCYTRRVIFGDSVHCFRRLECRQREFWQDTCVVGRFKLSSLFRVFPGGAPGIALLLLRTAAGFAAAIQGHAYLSSGNTTHLSFLIGVLALAAGAFLVAGFLTPAVTALIAFGAVGRAFSLWPPPASDLFGTWLPNALVFVMSVATGVLGPGAFSVDARLFGFREIIIPRIDRPGH
jgi:hypothetical protein